MFDGVCQYVVTQILLHVYKLISCIDDFWSIKAGKKATLVNQVGAIGVALKLIVLLLLTPDSTQHF